MQIEEIRHRLESPQESKSLLQEWNVRDAERGFHNLTGLANAIGVERLKDLSQPLSRLLPRCPDPDMALNSLERFLRHPYGVKHFPALILVQSLPLAHLLQL